MQAGVLAVVDGSFDVVGSFTDAITDGGQELQRCLDVERVFSLPSGETAFAGHAAREYRREREVARIAGGGVDVDAEPRTETRHTNFVGIPGEFVVVGSGRGRFAFDLIGEDTNTNVERATLDLDGFYERHDGASAWQAGFAGANGDGVSGVLHGDDLQADHDLDGFLDGASLNQVGLSHRYGNDQVKMTASESGYVEVYQPRDFDARTFLGYLQNEIVPHVR